MKAKSSLILTSIILSFLLTSCGTYYYYPFKQNTFNFEEKGDVTLALGIDSNFDHFHIGGAITDNIGVILDHNIDKNSYSSITDIELVLYDKTQSNLIAELNFGYGFGKINWEDKSSIRFTAHRPYIQPAFGYSNKYFEIGISSRFSYLKHKMVVPDDFRSDLDFYLESWTEVYDVSFKDFIFFEPAFTIAGKYKGLKLQLQSVKANQLTSNKIKYVENDSNITLSYSFNLNKLIDAFK